MLLLSFDVKTKSIYSDNEKLTGHLMSADFFDVEKFPEAGFKSTEIFEAKADGATHKITGNMTIREITKNITFPATVKAEGDMVNAMTEFTLKRFDYGIEFKGRKDDLIKDEVLLKINLAIPTSAEAGGDAAEKKEEPAQ